MKNKNLILTLFFATIICSISCEKTSRCSDYPDSCGKIEINRKECLVMCGEPKEPSLNSYVKLTIYNHTKQDMVWENAYCLQYFNGTDWILLNSDMIFTDIGYILKPDKTAETKIPVSGEHTIGKYRVIKNIGNQYGSYNLYFEFEIK